MALLGAVRRSLASDPGSVSKKRAIGMVYVAFGSTLIASGLSIRPIGVWIGFPFLGVGIWALRPTQ